MPFSLACFSTLDSVVPSIEAINSTLDPLVTMFSIWESWFGMSSSAYCRSVLYPRSFRTLTMLLPSSIQRAEALVGMAMPTVGLSCASTGPARATAPSTTADRAVLIKFMLRSQSFEPQSPRGRGLLLAPAMPAHRRSPCRPTETDDRSQVAVLQVS